MKPRLSLALCLEYPLGQMGGMEILVQELILGLSEKFDLILVSADRDLSECPEPFRCRLKSHFHWNHWEARPTKARQLIQHLSEAGVDLIHFHLGATYSWQTHKAWQSPVYYARRFKLPYLLTNHKVYPELEGYSKPTRPIWTRMLLLPKAWLSRALILSATPCEITVSRHDRKAMQRLFPFWSKRFRHLYHSRIPLQEIEQEEKDNPPVREKLIVCAATMGFIKGQLVLARAFARLASRFPEWKLQFVGRKDDGAYQRQLDEVKNALANPEQIQWGDVIQDFKILRQRLRQASIYVQPSLVEGLGLAVQEALAMGCPAVGSDVGGIPEMIEPGINGLLVPPGNAEALAEALEQLMEDETLRRRLGQAALEEIKRRRMTREDMLSRYVELYRDLLAATERS